MADFARGILGSSVCTPVPAAFVACELCDGGSGVGSLASSLYNEIHPTAANSARDFGRVPAILHTALRRYGIGGGGGPH